MFVFQCARCDAELTSPLTEVALPVHAHQIYGNGAQLPVLMEAGTFAVDPEPSGPPWRMGDEVDPGEAAARGLYAPVLSLSMGAPGAVVIAPGDVRGTRLVPERSGGACCGLDGRDGPNAACLACGLPVATRLDDCSLWQAVWLVPTAVRRVRVDGAADAPLAWDEVVRAANSTPPMEPIGTWGGMRNGTGHCWAWSPQWQAAAGKALAHLLAASAGRPVTVPGGLTADVFQRALDVMLPAGGPSRRAVLAGPGRPAPDAGADILLVPTHPQTGLTWTPPDPTAAPHLVPLPLGIWLWLTSPRPNLPIPASGGLPGGLLRDDPLPPRPNCLFHADPRTFQDTVARLPAARGRWLREILQKLPEYTSRGLF
ncbi:hypothetical protein ACIBL6_16240 [Streptomyces sp. NPDC050400]|uniref:hypothetical protein n=1 Tax=Streptomyces sp. NPDC050400 TaxID=3365610 RepID=UPI0037B226F9